jgi:hypothetical protein
MPEAYEKTIARSFSKLDPATYRSIALTGSVLVAAVDTAFGGSWGVMLIAGGLAAGVSALLPTRAPVNALQGTALKALLALRSLPRLLQSGLVILFVLSIVVLTYSNPIFTLGRCFNLFLVPVLLTSLLFGPRIGAFALLLSIVGALFSAIPPRDSFALNSLTDFSYLIVFAYLGAIVWAMPLLIFESSVAAVGADRS